MRLTRKHIGQLFDVDGGDGSWCHQLVAIKKNTLLFYSFDGKYVTDSIKTADWRLFKPAHPFDKRWIEYGWAQTTPKRNKK